jgi:hypothetical protein
VVDCTALSGRENLCVERGFTWKQLMSDFEELVAILALNRVAENTFIGSHPSKNLLRTFGGQLMAQSFVG